MWLCTGEYFCGTIWSGLSGSAVWKRKCWDGEMSCWMTQMSSDLKGTLQGFKRDVLSNWWIGKNPVIYKSLMANTGVDPILTRVSGKTPTEPGFRRSMSFSCYKQGNDFVWGTDLSSATLSLLAAGQLKPVCDLCIACTACRCIVWAHDVVWVWVIASDSVVTLCKKWSFALCVCVYIYVINWRLEGRKNLKGNSSQNKAEPHFYYKYTVY